MPIETPEAQAGLGLSMPPASLLVGAAAVSAARRAPLPALGPRRDRLLLRVVAALALGQVTALAGAEHILPTKDPFVLVANHSSRREAVYVPALLMLLRGGRAIHWLADWNFRLIPGAGWLYECAAAITVARKPARPRFLTPFRRRFRRGPSALHQARARLEAGAPVGLFPEGTVNRDPRRLLTGQRGAARLSLESGVPAVPVGIRFAGRRRDGLIRSSSPIAIEIGAPLHPPRTGDASAAAVAAWHAEIMAALAGLSGKGWKAP